MIEFIVWSIRLWLVDYRDRVKWREGSLTLKYMTYGWPWRWLRDFVDRISPFDAFVGYRRVLVRQVLWRLSHLGPWLRLTSLRWALVILDRAAPYTGPGRYEGMNPDVALKVEWLDAHMEYADREVGSVETLFVALFLDLDVPWSRTPESWILAIDSQGFVTGFEPDDPKATFEQYAAAYMGGDEDIEDEEWTNREGQPEFNGAFR